MLFRSTRLCFFSANHNLAALILLNGGRVGYDLVVLFFKCDEFTDKDKVDDDDGAWVEMAFVTPQGASTSQSVVTSHGSMSLPSSVYILY